MLSRMLHGKSFLSQAGRPLTPPQRDHNSDPVIKSPGQVK